MNYNFGQLLQPLVTDMSRRNRKSPEEIGTEIGEWLNAHPTPKPPGLSKIQSDWWDICAEPVPREVMEGIGAVILDVAANLPKQKFKKQRREEPSLS